MVCSRCIYDETIPYITFDENGICNYCHQYDSMDREYPTGEDGHRRIEKLTAQIRREGRQKKYDAVVGISGGCDSSFMLYKAKELGLRPLAAHFDNTWNSKIAVENIHNILTKLKVDLFTYVVDSREFNDIFKSFLKAGVPDIDTPSDIGLAVTHYLAARKYGVRYIFEGHSFRTEGISPHSWFYMDAKYIQSVHRQFGTLRMKTFSNLWMRRWLKWMIVDRIKKIRPLYYLDYKKEEAKAFLARELGWNWYGGHHMENRTAYFTNNYYLPLRFGIDLRYTEFSALVRSGQMAREEAIRKIKEPKAIDQGIVEEVKNRLGFSNDEFEVVMKQPLKTYRDFHTYKQTFERMKPFFWVLYKFNLVTKSFYLKYTRTYEQ